MAARELTAEEWRIQGAAQVRAMLRSTTHKSFLPLRNLKEELLKKDSKGIKVDECKLLDNTMDLVFKVVPDQSEKKLLKSGLCQPTEDVVTQLGAPHSVFFTLVFKEANSETTYEEITVRASRVAFQL
jgi:hypothetical protein